MHIHFPTGATHLRITSPDGKHSTISKADAETALMGVAGEIVFLLKEKNGKFSQFAGDPIPNPLANGKLPEKETKAEVKEEPARAPKGEKKSKFIADLADGKLTAREVATKVVAKFPDSKLNETEQFEKALRFVRAMPWHMKKAGKKGPFYAAGRGKSQS